MAKKVEDIKTVEDNALKKSVGFLSWVQEFSKKIVAVTFLLFVAVNVFVMVLMFLQYYASGMEPSGLETLLSEAHVTFRDVIGGYIIKAASENVLKIGGGIVEKYLANKLQEKQMDIDCNSDDSSGNGEELPVEDI